MTSQLNYRKVFVSKSYVFVNALLMGEEIVEVFGGRWDHPM